MTCERTDTTREPDSPTTTRTDSPQSRDSANFGWRRRHFLRTTGSLAVAGLLSGCTDEGDGENDGNEGNEPSDRTGSNSVDGWLSDTGNYDSVEGMTGESAVTVEVGARGNAGANAFAPAAIEISPGTTVTWEWVDGHHNVVATDGEFNSGKPEQNATFQHTFETPGMVRYYCEPHRRVDMKGAVVVAEAGESETTGTASNRV